MIAKHIKMVLIVSILILSINIAFACEAGDDDYSTCKWDNEQYLSTLEGEDLITAIQDGKIRADRMEFINDGALAKAIKENGEIPSAIKDKDLARALAKDPSLLDSDTILKQFEARLDSYNGLKIINENPNVLDKFMGEKYPNIKFERSEGDSTAKIFKYSPDGYITILKGGTFNLNQISPAKIKEDGCVVSENYGSFCSGEIDIAYDEEGIKTMYIKKAMTSKGGVDLTGVKNIKISVDDFSQIHIGDRIFSSGGDVDKSNKMKSSSHYSYYLKFEKGYTRKNYFGFDISITDGVVETSGREVILSEGSRKHKLYGNVVVYDNGFLLREESKVEYNSDKGDLKVDSGSSELNFYIDDNPQIDYWHAKKGSWRDYPCKEGERCIVLAENTGVISTSTKDIRLASNRNSFYPIIWQNEVINSHELFSEKMAIHHDSNNGLSTEEVDAFAEAIGEELAFLTKYDQSKIENIVREDIYLLSREENQDIYDFITNTLVPSLEEKYQIKLKYDIQEISGTSESRLVPITVETVNPFPEGEDLLQERLSVVEDTGLRAYITEEGAVDSKNNPIPGYENVVLQEVVADDLGGAKALVKHEENGVTTTSERTLAEMFDSPERIIEAAKNKYESVVTIENAELMYNSIQGVTTYVDDNPTIENEATVAMVQDAFKSIGGPFPDLIGMTDNKYGMNTRNGFRSAGVAAATMLIETESDRQITVTSDPYSSLLKEYNTAMSFDISGSSTKTDIMTALTSFGVLTSGKNPKSYGLGVYSDENAISAINKADSENIERITQTLSETENIYKFKRYIKDELGGINDQTLDQQESAFATASASIDSAFEANVFKEGEDNQLLVHLDYDGSSPDKFYTEVESVNNMAQERGVKILYVVGGSASVDGMPRIIEPEEITKSAFKKNSKDGGGFRWTQKVKEEDFYDAESSAYLGVPLDVYFEMEYAKRMKKLENDKNQNIRFNIAQTDAAAGAPQAIGP